MNHVQKKKKRKMSENESKSETPASMYSWRVKALDSWLCSKSAGGREPVTMMMLNQAGHLDQFHYQVGNIALHVSLCVFVYQGIEANNEIIELLQVDASDKLLDVGSGIGGPARYISWKTGCSVDGFDIQPDLVEKANEVAQMVGLDGEGELHRNGRVHRPLCSEGQFNRGPVRWILLNPRQPTHSKGASVGDVQKHWKGFEGDWSAVHRRLRPEIKREAADN